MSWPVTFTLLIWTMAAGLLLPGAVLWCIPGTVAAGRFLIRTGRAVAIIATLTAPVLNFLMMRFAANDPGHSSIILSSPGWSHAAPTAGNATGRGETREALA
jgi:hypothetical protein